MTPMRILLVVHQFFPDFSAGTETLVLRTAQELNRRGYECIVLTSCDVFSNFNSYSEEVWDGVRIIKCRLSNPLSFSNDPVLFSFNRNELVLFYESVIAHINPISCMFSISEGTLRPLLLHVIHCVSPIYSLLPIIGSHALPDNLSFLPNLTA